MSTRKRKPPKVKDYLLMEECVEIGLRFGYRHAHKHTETPTEDHILGEQLCEIMLALSERFEL